jgi:hypothetical protein
MSEPAAPPEAKEYPEFPGEKLSKRCVPWRFFHAHPTGALRAVTADTDAGYARRDSYADGDPYTRDARIHTSPR